MTYSVKFSAIANLTLLSASVLLAACSHDQSYKRQVDGNLDYIKAEPLKNLTAPAGMVLPLRSNEYDIGHASSKGSVGTALDIRPPAQSLALMDGSQTQILAGKGMLTLNDNQDRFADLLHLLNQQKIGIAEQNADKKQLKTTWVKWQRPDEDHQYQGRYQIEVTHYTGRQQIIVTLLQLQQDGKDVTGQAEQQRYTSQLLNLITDKLNASAAKSANHQSGQTEIIVQSGADDTGLPNAIIRAPFTQVWQRLPNALAKIGMKVTDSDRSDGSIQVTYSAPNDETWKTLRVTDPGLDNGKYKLQLGDLENRSSLQFIDPKGHVLTQSQNDALIAALQAAFK